MNRCRPILTTACACWALLAGCELTEVAAPASEDVLVVEGVLRVGSTPQKILLHRSVEGRVVRGEPGATVVVGGESGERISFVEGAIANCVGELPEEWRDGSVKVAASCYLASPDFVVRPGAAYELEIKTAKGEVVRGRTRVPGATSFVSPSVPLDPVTLQAECELPESPFTLAWRSAEGAWAYVVALHLSAWTPAGSGLPDPVYLTSVSVSAADTTLLFPANIGLFQRGEIDSRVFDILRTGLPNDGASTLAVMAIDRNYTNAIRGGRFNPSGNVRISSVAGDGVGVFGSVVPIIIRSGGRLGSARCPGTLPPGAN